MKLIHRNNRLADLPAQDEEELYEKAKDWAAELWKWVPESRLEQSYERALDSIKGPYGPNAFQIRDAWKTLHRENVVRSTFGPPPPKILDTKTGLIRDVDPEKDEMVHPSEGAEILARTLRDMGVSMETAQEVAGNVLKSIGVPDFIASIIGLCPKCKGPAYPSDIEGYAAVCYRCDENLYTFEVINDDDKNIPDGAGDVGGSVDPDNVGVDAGGGNSQLGQGNDHREPDADPAPDTRDMAIDETAEMVTKQGDTNDDG